jgi:tetratricopeptide (TPR) repeat protein
MAAVSASANTLEVFYSYAQQDEKWQKEIEKHLTNLKRQKLIVGWNKREIGAGTDWKRESHAHLNTAHLILLLISPDFLASEYCYSVEMTRAIERYKAGEAVVIPLLLRPVDCQGTPFEELQGLPKNGKPLSQWRDRDKALLEVQAGIRAAVLHLNPTLHPISAEDVSSAAASGEEQPNKPTPLPPIQVFHVPHGRNPFFTGRQDILAQVHETLIAESNSSRTPVALSGLGGVGKTQTAIEYAYRYQEEYSVVLWVKAESRDVLASDFVTIAGLLTLPEKDVQDQSSIIRAVKNWLEANSHWLLLLDNVEDLDMIEDFLPKRSTGQILLTTHEYVMSGKAQRIKLEPMEPQEGTLLLLRRADIIPRDADLDSALEADCTQAEEIVQIMDGLPLGLDQAGAYIEETACGLSGYAELFHTHQKELLNRADTLFSAHEPVATTWDLAFKNVQAQNAAAADLLRLCAFLYPDAIPEEIVNHVPQDCSPHLHTLVNNPLTLNEAIVELLKYSLIRRDPTSKTLAMHRLMQFALKNGMSEDTQSQWAACTVRTVNEAFPKVEFDVWSLCQWYLPHAQSCTALLQQYTLAFPEAASLLNKMGHYLWDRGEFAEAEPLLEKALEMREQVLGAEHPDLAQSLNDLGVLYNQQGMDKRAELLHHRALAIRETVLEPEHPDVAQSLDNLGSVYYDRNQYTQAELFSRRALAILEKVQDQKPLDFALTLRLLGACYTGQEKYVQANAHLQHALTIYEHRTGSNHPDTADCLRSLGSAFYHEHNYQQAESFYVRAIAIQEKILGLEHIRLAHALFGLATLYNTWRKFSKADPLYQRCLAIYGKVLGAENIQVAEVLEGYALLLRKTKRKTKAAEWEARAEMIRAKYAQENVESEV